jgi:hypothetical protein
LEALGLSEEGDIHQGGREDCKLFREALMRDPRMTHKEVNIPQIVQMLQGIWVREHPPARILEGVSAYDSPNAPSMGRVVEESAQATWAGRGPDVDPDSAILLVFHILHLLAEGVEPADIVDAVEAAFLLYPRGLYTWARRGSEAVPIHVAGHGRQPTPSWPLS